MMVTRASPKELIPRGSVFVEESHTNGRVVAIFRLLRIGESLRLLAVASPFFFLALLVVWRGLENRRGDDSNTSLECFLMAVIPAVIGALILCRSLRNAFTVEALIFDPSTQCLRWIRKTPLSRQSDTLSADQMSDVLIRRMFHTNDEEGRPVYRFSVSLRGLTGAEWLRVAHFCDEGPAVRLAHSLSRLTRRQVEWTLDEGVG